MNLKERVPTKHVMRTQTWPVFTSRWEVLIHVTMQLPQCYPWALRDLLLVILALSDIIGALSPSQVTVLNTPMDSSWMENPTVETPRKLAVSDMWLMAPTLKVCSLVTVMLINRMHSYIGEVCALNLKFNGKDNKHYSYWASHAWKLPRTNRPIYPPFLVWG